MGQKTHPKAFRLSITQKHSSNWYSSKAAYPSLLYSDFLIREKLEETFKNFLTISKIEILRGGYNNFYTTILITALHPRVNDIFKSLLKDIPDENKQKHLLNLLQKKNLKNNDATKSQQIKELLCFCLKKGGREAIRQLNSLFAENFVIKFNFIKNSFDDATLIAKAIGNLIKKRVPFRRVIKQSIKKAQLAGLTGIKVELSGRLNGVDIARSEWKRIGKIPLHTLDANVEYSARFVNTVYGIIGIKVWVYKNSNNN